ncbi:zinc ribbon domain-containing protein [Vagococcus teuberi]
MTFLDRFTPKKKNQFTKNNERYYKILLTVIASLYLLIIGLSITNPNEGKYLATENGKVIESSTNGQFKVINRFYDPNTKRYQLILWLTGDRSLQEDYQTELTATSVVKTDLSTQRKSKVTRIGRRYFSIVVSNVPKEYEAVRTDIVVKSRTTPESDPYESEIKLYSKDSQTTNKPIKEETKFFKEQAVDTQLKETDLEIQTLKKEIKGLRSDIKETNNLIANIESDMKLQVSDEKEESKQTLEDYRSQIAQKEKEIEEHYSQIEELEKSKTQVDSLF